MRKFNFVLLTCVILSAIMTYIMCERQQVQASVNSQQNAVCRATFRSGANSSYVEMHEVCLDGKYYLVATYGSNGVSVIPMNKPSKMAERVQ